LLKSVELLHRINLTIAEIGNTVWILQYKLLCWDVPPLRQNVFRRNIEAVAQYSHEQMEYHFDKGNWKRVRKYHTSAKKIHIMRFLLTADFWRIRSTHV
jgi:hypothetical protein